MTWAPDYVTSPELKDYIGISDNVDDVFVALWITTVSRNVDDFCGRQFGKVAAAEERHYTPVYDRHEGAWFAEVDDVQDVTGMTVTDESGTAVTDYVLLPRNAAQKGRPYERLRLSACTGEIAAEAPWGWTAVPAAARVGLLLQGKRLAKRKDSPFGISGSPQEQGEIRLLAQLDVDFKTSLKPLVRKWWAA
jgi:hypothetical protein